MSPVTLFMVWGHIAMTTTETCPERLRNDLITVGRMTDRMRSTYILCV